MHSLNPNIFQLHQTVRSLSSNTLILFLLSVPQKLPGSQMNPLQRLK